MADFELGGQGKSEKYELFIAVLARRKIRFLEGLEIFWAFYSHF
jgi:hypothetical protein